MAMDVPMDMQAAQALVRFGLGRRGDEPVPGDPARWLAAQLQHADPARIASAPSTARGLAAVIAERQQRRAARQLASAAMTPGTMTPATMTPGGATPAVVTPGTPGRFKQAGPARGPGQPSPLRAVFEADARAELDNALTTPAPFRERLVWFWTNHFTV
jgi:uncharacterized protein (DUF1800 family)